MTTTQPTRTCTNCGRIGLSHACPGCGAPTNPSTSTTAPPTNGVHGAAGGSPPPTYAAPATEAAPPTSAKTSPWVKALAIGGAIFLTMIIGCTALLGTAANEVGKELNGGNAGETSDASEVVKRAGVNQPLSLKGTTYQVTGVETASSLGSEFTRTEANGVFLIVSLSLTNNKAEPATIITDNLRVVGGNGSSYSVSDDALLALDDQQFLLEEIQPGVSEQGKLVYDLPANALRGAELQTEDLFSAEKGRIALGF